MVERSVLVLGDLGVDTIFDAPELDVSAGSNFDELSQWGPLVDHVGGTAYHFARHAAEASLNPVIIGCIGSDEAGRQIERKLTAEKLPHHLWRVADPGTARAILIYGSGGTRMMFTASLNANLSMPARFVDEVWDRMSTCTAVWVSGVCLRNRTSERFGATLKILEYAQACGMKVILDVVPHDFHRYYSDVEALVAEVGTIDVVVCDLVAARRLLRVASTPDGEPDTMLRETADLLLPTFESVLIRYRSGLDYRQLYSSRDGSVEWANRHIPAVSAARGYGDRLACEVLSRVLPA